MKKLRFLALIMSVLLIFCSSGCNKKKDESKTNSKPTTSSINSDNNKNDETTIDSSNSSDSDDDTNTHEEDNVTSRRPKLVKTDPNAVVRVSWNGPKGYRIIVPAGNADMMKAAKVLQEYIKTKFNTSVDIAEDSVAKTAKEILIGVTNRNESVKNTAYNGYSMDVKNGKLDAVVVDSATGKALAEKNGLKVVEDPTVFDTEEYAIAVKKGNTELLKQINKVLADMKESGEIDALAEKYN